MKKETQTIEFKQSWHDEYLKWICGVANAQSAKLDKEIVRNLDTLKFNPDIGGD